MAIGQAIRPSPVFSLKRRLTFVAVLLFLVVSIPTGSRGANPGEAELSASFDVDTAKVGDTVILTLTYTLPKGARLPEDIAIRGFEGLTVVGTEEDPGQIRVKLVVDRLETLATGPLQIAYKKPDGETAFLTADPASLEVASILGETPGTAELKPIRDIVSTRSLWLRFLPWGIGLLVLAGIVGWVFLWRRRRRSIRRMNADLLDPPHIQAKKALDRLESVGIFERGEVKAYYFRISELLRDYMGAIRPFPAAEMTTEEIAHRIDLPEDRELLRLLRQADMVKFADDVPTLEKKTEHVRAAHAYIDATTPVEETTEGLEGPSQGRVSVGGGAK